MTRPVHPAALLAVGVFLGWALAQPFLVPEPEPHGSSTRTASFSARLREE
jgi:hypothetical protein